MLSLLFLAFALSVSAQEHRLFKTLFANHEKNVRPVVNDKDTVTVNIGFMIQDVMYFSYQDNEIRMLLWPTFKWNDAFLTWDPTQYENTTKVNVPSSLVWLPDIEIYSSKQEKRLLSGLDYRAIVSHDGSVLIVPRVDVHANCLNSTSGNGGVVTCSLKFGSWTYNGEQVDLEADSVDLSFLDSHGIQVLSAELERNEVKYECCPERYVDVKLFLKMKLD